VTSSPNRCSVSASARSVRSRFTRGGERPASFSFKVVTGRAVTAPAADFACVPPDCADLPESRTKEPGASRCLCLTGARRLRLTACTVPLPTQVPTSVRLRDEDRNGVLFALGLNALQVRRLHPSLPIREVACRIGASRGKSVFAAGNEVLRIIPCRKPASRLHSPNRRAECSPSPTGVRSHPRRTAYPSLAKAVGAQDPRRDRARARADTLRPWFIRPIRFVDHPPPRSQRGRFAGTGKKRGSTIMCRRFGVVRRGGSFWCFLPFPFRFVWPLRTAFKPCSNANELRTVALKQQHRCRLRPSAFRAGRYPDDRFARATVRYLSQFGSTHLGIACPRWNVFSARRLAHQPTKTPPKALPYRQLSRCGPK